jgi:hypothetical protein
MKLSNPIVVQIPSYKRSNGEVKNYPAVTLTSLEYIITDIPSQRVCFAAVLGVPVRVALWTGTEYDTAGDYTQEQADARLLELLGSDIKAGLEKLMPKAT